MDGGRPGGGGRGGHRLQWAAAAGYHEAAATGVTPAPAMPLSSNTPPPAPHPSRARPAPSRVSAAGPVVEGRRRAADPAAPAAARAGLEARGVPAVGAARGHRAVSGGGGEWGTGACGWAGAGRGPMAGTAGAAGARRRLLRSEGPSPRHQLAVPRAATATLPASQTAPSGRSPTTRRRSSATTPRRPSPTARCCRRCRRARATARRRCATWCSASRTCASAWTRSSSGGTAGGRCPILQTPTARHRSSRRSARSAGRVRLLGVGWGGGPSREVVAWFRRGARSRGLRQHHPSHHHAPPAVPAPQPTCRPCSRGATAPTAPSSRTSARSADAPSALTRGCRTPTAAVPRAELACGRAAATAGRRPRPEHQLGCPGCPQVAVNINKQSACRGRPVKHAVRDLGAARRARTAMEPEQPLHARSPARRRPAGTRSRPAPVRGASRGDRAAGLPPRALALARARALEGRREGIPGRERVDRPDRRLPAPPAPTLVPARCRRRRRWRCTGASARARATARSRSSWPRSRCAADWASERCAVHGARTRGLCVQRRARCCRCRRRRSLPPPAAAHRRRGPPAARGGRRRDQKGKPRARALLPMHARPLSPRCCACMAWHGMACHGGAPPPREPPCMLGHLHAPTPPLHASRAPRSPRTWSRTSCGGSCSCGRPARASRAAPPRRSSACGRRRSSPGSR
jgi:hypothetical protein